MVGGFWSEMRAKCRQAGQHAQAVHRHSTIILAGWAATSGFVASYVNDWPLQFAIPIIILAIGGTVWLTWSTYKAPLVVEQIGAVAELERDFVNASVAAQFGATFSAWASACSTLIERKCRNETLDEAALIESIREFLAATDPNADALFGFDRRERWGLTVYRHDSASNKLRHVARIASSNHPRRNHEGRSWNVGDGHVGRAWVGREPLLASDATNPDVKSAYPVPADIAKPDDDELYRSYVSAPIGGEKNGPPPFGVLVATSDRIGRFDRPAIQPIEFGAKSLAVLFHLRHNEH